AKRERLGGENHFDQAGLEELFDELFVVGQQARVVHRQAASQHPRVDHALVKGQLVRVTQVPQAVGRNRLDGGLFLRRGQVQRVVGAALERLPAAAAGEDE